MNHAMKRGFGFGLTSGIITTLGLMIGLQATTNSVKVVISGILVIAIADALSDSLGMHLSEEAIRKKTNHVWESTISTFLSKFVFALTFIIPVLLFPLNVAIIISIIYGLGLIALFSYHIAQINKIEPHKVIAEHIIITVLVIVVTHYIGKFIAVFM